MKTQMIQVALIDAPTWNSRVPKPGDDIQIEALAEEFRAAMAEGNKEPIKQPIRVQTGPTKGRYTFVYGFRRLSAAKMAGMTEIPCVLDEGQPNSKGQKLANVVENFQRQDLTPFEQGRAFCALREEGYKLEDISKHVGRGGPYISKLVTIMVKMGPAADKPGDAAATSILDAWKNQHPMATVPTLYDIAQLPDHKTMLETWEKMVATSTAVAEEEDEESGDGDGDADKPKKKVKKYIVPDARYRLALRAIKAKKQPALMAAMCKFLIGKTDIVPGVIDEEEETE